MLGRVLNAWRHVEPVHVARTEAERSAVFRARYEVYVEEQHGTTAAGIDHARRELRTPEDDLPETTLFYIGALPNILGSLRVRAWQPGQIPADFARQFSLERFPDIATRSICNVAYLVARRTMRGKFGVVALTAGAIEATVRAHGTEMMLSGCAPGLIAGYRRLGLRPYGGRVFSHHIGMCIPVAGVTADLEYTRRCGSPWHPTLARLAARGELPVRDFSALQAPFVQGGIEADPVPVAAAIESVIAGRGSPFLGGLPAATRRRLARGAMVIDVEPGVDLIVEGFANRDIFVVLSGAVEMRVGDRPTAVLGPGEVLGEVALLGEEGRHAASVRTLAAGKVLHIRHGSLARLTTRHPADAMHVYASLARVLAARLARGLGGVRGP